MNNEEGFVGPVNLGNPEERTISALAQKDYFRTIITQR